MDMDILIHMDIILASVKLRLNQKQRLTLLFCMEDITDIILDTLDITDIHTPMDIILLASVRLNLKQRLKLTLLFCMEDITDIILDMLDTMVIPIPMDTLDIMESVMLRPNLKLTLLFSMVDTMDTT